MKARIYLRSLVLLFGAFIIRKIGVCGYINYIQITNVTGTQWVYVWIELTYILEKSLAM